MERINNSYIFVGEKPSLTALKNDWTWEDGRLAAAQLKRALENLGISFCSQWFTNVLSGTGIDQEEIDRIEAGLLEGGKIVAMGKKVSFVLDNLGIHHLTIPHPAARGRIRRKELYQEAVRNGLGL